MLRTQKRTSFAALGFLTVLLLQPFTVCAQQSIQINGIDVRVGMDKKTILTNFTDYRLQCAAPLSSPLSECDSLLIQGDHAPYDLYANAVFERGKLKSIRKYWSRGYEGTDPAKFVQTLYSLLSAQSQQGANSLRIAVSERREPGILEQTILLTAGHKTIQISYSEGYRNPDGKTIAPFVNLYEMLE